MKTGRLSHGSSVAVVLVVLVLALVGLLSVWLLASMPRLEGESRLSGLQADVRIERDTSDVVHIRAQSALDAWKALGYLHAQERGWQLEFNRRLMHGELSAVLGASTLQTDQLIRTLGIVQAAQRQWEKLPASTQAALQAYSDGINAFYADPKARIALEMRILNARPAAGQAWTPQDSVAWALMMALDLGGNWGVEASRLRAAQVLSTRELWDLFPAYPGEAPVTQVDLAGSYAHLGVYNTPAPTQGGGAAPSMSGATDVLPPAPLLAQFDADFAAGLGAVEGKGSNNWVVHGSRTQSGLPLLANDPHLGLSAPAIWYFAHMQAPASSDGAGGQHPSLNVMGATLPGLPFVVLGRTDTVAWGFTNTNPDVQDLYLEQLDPAQPGKYRTPTGWEPLQTRTETVQVKGQADVPLMIEHSRHGPILSRVQPSYATFLNRDKYAVALRWSALDADNLSVHAGIRSNFARNVDELIAAYADHHSPMQNVVMADVEGKVHYKAAGRMPLRAATNDLMGAAPAPGWMSEYDWTGWVPYAQTPEVNEATIAKVGWHATANQRITPEGYPLFVTSDWVTPERYDRIAHLLQAHERHDMGSMARIQTDVLSTSAQKLQAHLRRVTSQHRLAAAAQEALASFDGHMRTDSSAALIISVWSDEWVRQVIGSKLGPDRFKALYVKRAFRTAMENILERNDPSWCGAQGCAVINQQTLERTLDRLSALYGSQLSQWRWGAAHTAISSHKPMSHIPVLGSVFEVRQASPGDGYTVNVGQYWPGEAQDPFANRHAASLRAIYDLSDLDRSAFIYQTGQSGHPLSPQYRNMAKEWAQGQYRLLSMQANPGGIGQVLKP